MRLYALRPAMAICAILLIACRSASTPVPEPPDRLSHSLVEATRGNRIADVRILLMRGANPDSMETGGDGGGDTALILAVKAGNVELARTLIDAGAHVNLRQHGRQEGVTPLIVAAGQGQEGMVRLLLASGSNVNARRGGDGTQPGALHWAVRGNHLGAVSLLLGEGAIVERRDVFEAIHGGRPKLVALLLAGGADPHWRFSTGRTVLEEAQRSPEATRRDVIAAVRLAIGPIPHPDPESR